MTRKRKRASKGSKTVLGVAWYSREQWQRLREAVADPQLLEDTYEQWEAMADSTLKELGTSGITLEKVLVEAEEFLTWCRAEDQRPDSAARARFAAEKLRRKYQEEERDSGAKS